MPRNQQCNQVLAQEVDVMLRLASSGQTASKSVTHIYGYSIDQGVMTTQDGEIYSDSVSYFITDLAEMGDLATHVATNVAEFKRGISEQNLFKLFEQLLDAVESVHKQGFVHLDLKPNNVLIFSQSNVAISDFALSKPIDGEDGNGNFVHYKVGSKCYWSPEMFTRLPYNGVKADLYALGIILFILTFGCCPFLVPNLSDSLFKILVRNPVEFWKSHPEASRRISESSVSPGLVKLINFMLCPYPQYRLGIDEIRSQEWFKECSASDAFLYYDQKGTIKPIEA